MRQRIIPVAPKDWFRDSGPSELPSTLTTLMMSDVNGKGNISTVMVDEILQVVT